jgi:hypothetical protein
MRNAMHYDGQVFERVDWSRRGAYMHRKHGIAPAIADEALEDPNRVVIDPDYNSEAAGASGSSGSRGPRTTGSPSSCWRTTGPSTA